MHTKHLWIQQIGSASPTAPFSATLRSARNDKERQEYKYSSWYSRCGANWTCSFPVSGYSKILPS